MPSTLPVAAGSTASTSTWPRVHAWAGAVARTVSPSAAANRNRVMDRLPVDLDPPDERWVRGENTISARGAEGGGGTQRPRHRPRRRAIQYSVSFQLIRDRAYWMPAFAGMTS